MINPTNIYPPVAPYSQGVLVDSPKKFLFISGTVGMDKNLIIPDHFADQCHLTWNNIKSTLQEAQMNVENIVKMTCFLTDKKYRKLNASIRDIHLGNHKPATTVIATELLDNNWKLEIEIVAAA